MVKRKIQKPAPKKKRKPKDITKINPPEVILGESGVNVINNSFLLNQVIDETAFTNVYDRVNQILNYNQYAFNKAPETITCYINSYGGDLYCMFSIINFLKSIPSKVDMHCYGMAMSAGAIIFTCTSGERILSNASTMMFHQIRTSLYDAKAFDAAAATEDIKNKQIVVSKMLAEHTKKDAEFWDKVVINDFYPSSIECVEYGVADSIVM